MAGDIEVGELSRGQGDRNALCLARFQHYTLKTAEAFDRLYHVRLHLMNIHLCHLRTSSRPRILEIERDANLSCCISPVLGELQIAVLELRVAQAVAKGVEWYAFEIEIGETL